ncbi:hypothetical protein Taro_047893, partial [Colocasia esculenta]|nr:hypothetical protein [Colocasia esculenta]
GGLPTLKGFPFPPVSPVASEQPAATEKEHQHSVGGGNGGGMRPRRLLRSRSAGAEGAAAAAGFPDVIDLLHLVVSLGLIMAVDKFIKRAFLVAAIKLPSAVFGMFCVFILLMVLDSTAPSVAKGIVDFFEPATMFIRRWLPLFYVPSLVVLPLVVRGVPASAELKICFIVAGGWIASLCVTGYTALTMRKIIKTEALPAEPVAKPSPFSSTEIWIWTAVFISSFTLASISPKVLGTSARTNLPFMLAATVLGYMVGSGLPSDVRKIFHPIICCVLSADLAAIAYGYLSRSGMDDVLGLKPSVADSLQEFQWSHMEISNIKYQYLDFLFSLGINSFHCHLQLIERHAAEISSSIVISTIFSLYSTAITGRIIGLEPALTLSILPRCITLALALSIASLFEGANASLTATVVVLTGLVGANFVQLMLDRLGWKDPIVRGIATATSSHGFGTAALTVKEPEALPFCAIAYALTGVSGSLLCSVPAVRQSLVSIAG